MACGRGNCRSECLILASKSPLLPKTYQKWKKQWVSRNEFFVLHTLSCVANGKRFSYKTILFVRVMIIHYTFAVSAAKSGSCPGDPL